MELNDVLIWIVLFSCGALVYRGLRDFRQYGSWLGVSVLILAVMGLVYLRAPRQAGLVGGGLWALLVLIPSLGTGLAVRMSLAQRYESAARLSAVLRLLHPGGGWWELPTLFRALALGRKGQLDEAARLLERVQTSRTAIGKQAQLQLFRLRGQWEESVAWMQEQATAQQLESDADFGLSYLRALGETGELATMVEVFPRLKESLDSAGPSALYQAYLHLFAFCGYPHLVQRLLAGPLAQYPAKWQQFWQLTAELAAGMPEARERLSALPEDDDALFRTALTRRLTHVPVNPAKALTASQSDQLEQLAAEFALEERYRPLAGNTPHAYATYALIAINLLVFGIELLRHGSTNESVLLRMGALQTTAFFHGEWWRALAAMFLHYGWVHLTMNMLALVIFGRAVEARLGAWRFTAVYFIAGLGSMLVVALLLRAPEEIVVGASGALMGLVGAFGAIALVGWLHEHAALARKQLLMIVTLVLLQSTFDLLNPHVSMTGHLSGVIIGFLATLAIQPRVQGVKRVFQHG